MHNLKLFFQWLFKGQFLKASFRRFVQKNEKPEKVNPETKNEYEETGVPWV